MYVLLIVFAVLITAAEYVLIVAFSRWLAWQTALLFVVLFVFSAFLNTLRLFFCVILWLSEYEREKGWRWPTAHVIVACGVALGWFVFSAELNHENLRLTIFQLDGLLVVGVFAVVGFFVMRFLVQVCRLSVAWALVAIVGAAVAFLVLSVPEDNPGQDRFTEVSELPRTIVVPHPERPAPWVLFVRLTPHEWRVRQIAVNVGPAFLGALLGGVPASVWRRVRSMKPKTAAQTIRELYQGMGPEVVSAILGGVGGYIEQRHGEVGRLSDLQWPAGAIEIAFIKALREWPDGPALEAARATYLSLDKWLLSDEDCALAAEYAEYLQRGRDPKQIPEFLTWSRTERGQRAEKVFFKLLNEDMVKRKELLEELNRQRKPGQQPVADGAKSSPVEGSA